MRTNPSNLPALLKLKTAVSSEQYANTESVKLTFAKQMVKHFTTRDTQVLGDIAMFSTSFSNLISGHISNYTQLTILSCKLDEICVASCIKRSGDNKTRVEKQQQRITTVQHFVVRPPHDTLNQFVKIQTFELTTQRHRKFKERKN